MIGLPEALAVVLNEHAKSIKIYGDWADYTTDQMMAVIIDELMCEAVDAWHVNDLHGDHGMIRELAQVAATSIKAIQVLSGRGCAVK